MSCAMPQRADAICERQMPLCASSVKTREQEQMAAALPSLLLYLDVHEDARAKMTSTLAACIRHSGQGQE